MKSLPTGSAAVGSWVLVGLLALAVLENVRSGDAVWTGFLVVTFAILLFPPLAARDPWEMLPPEVVALAVLPGVVRALWRFGPTWVGEYATYVGVAAVSLAVVVELTRFTEAEMAPWFADATVVLMTMAAIGVWAIVQFYSDQYLGTDLLGSLNATMWAFVRATVAGVLAAVFFELYFHVRESVDANPPGSLRGESE